MVEFTNREDVWSWLDGRPREVAVALAARSALRALPGVCDAPTETLGGLALATCRATLTSAVAAMGPTAEVEIREAAAAAHSAARSAAAAAFTDSAAAAADAAFSAYAAASADSASADSASSAVELAIHSAAGSAADRPAAFAADRPAAAAVSFDADRLMTDTPAFLFRLPLWQGAAMPEKPAQSLRALRAFWAQYPASWGFWARWYEGMLRGTPLPWDLQEAVALIPDEDWKAGPERVAERIREIENARKDGPDKSAVNAERERSGEGLKRHVQVLIEQAVMAEINAVGLAWQIKSAINSHCHANGINEIPEELKPFEAIATVLARIGGSLARVRLDKKAKDAVAEDLEAQIAELHLRIVSLESELAESTRKEVKGLVAQGFYRTLGTSFCVACTTSVMGAVSYFAVPDFAPDVVMHLGDRFFELFETPSHDLPQIGVDGLQAPQG